MLKAQELANFFICKGLETADPITHLKLQKLCYYAHAWHLAFNKRPLIAENFEAWAHGPVNPQLFQTYKSYGWEPIKRANVPNIDPQTEALLNEIWRVYGPMDAKQLEHLTHKEDPWLLARRGIPEGAASDNDIDNDVIEKYYSTIYKNNQ